MSHPQDTCIQHEVALSNQCLSTVKDNQDLERMSGIRYEGDIEDNMTPKTYYNTHLGLEGLAWVALLAQVFPS
jgi:hypothetical protein